MQSIFYKIHAKKLKWSLKQMKTYFSAVGIAPVQTGGCVGFGHRTRDPRSWYGRFQTWWRCSWANVNDSGGTGDVSTEDKAFLACEPCPRPHFALTFHGHWQPATTSTSSGRRWSNIICSHVPRRSTWKKNNTPYNISSKPTWTCFLSSTNVLGSYNNY